MPDRTSLINDLIREHGFSRYLEIGVQHRKNFDAIVCEEKVGVDPEFPGAAVFNVCSDDFFADNPTAEFDLVFVDGLHRHEQVERDIVNAIYHGAKIVVVHDCCPVSEDSQRVPRITREWMGDVWRAFVGLRALNLPFLKMYCYPWDCGVGVIEVSENRAIPTGFSTEMEYWEFDNNRKELLGFV
jgi:hypothetical protein